MNAIFEQKKSQAVKRQQQYGKGRDIVTTQFQDWRVVAVGNELHYAKAASAKFFPDFLGNYARQLLGQDWGNQEIAKPEEQKHQIIEWYQSMCRYQGTLTRDADGNYACEGTGAMLSWLRLGYDLYLIKHNAKLQEKILNRLRHRDQFQGARFELLVTAVLVTAGFEIEYEDESDGTRKHTELIATNLSGRKFAVEAKSKHRDGVLGYKSGNWKNKIEHRRTLHPDVEGIIQKAAAKMPENPLLIFVDPNLPHTNDLTAENPWYAAIKKSIETVQREYPQGAFPANAVFACNDPSYQMLDAIPNGNNFWCMGLPIEQPAHACPDIREITEAITRAAWQRTNVPNQFPDDPLADRSWEVPTAPW